MNPSTNPKIIDTNILKRIPKALLKTLLKAFRKAFIFNFQSTLWEWFNVGQV